MILNKQRIPFAFAIMILIVALSLASCIEVPDSSPPLPDYKSSVKYFYFGRGVDTISFSISSVKYTNKDSIKSAQLVGTDSVYTTTYITAAFLVDKYRRYEVNYGSQVNLIVDGSSKGLMVQGSTTGYFDTPSGSRKIEIRGSGTWVDSIRITKIDSTFSVLRDTVRGGVVVGKSKFDTTRSSYLVTKIPVTGTATVALDTTFLSFESERQRSVFFVGDTVASISKEKDQVRYGRIRYGNFAERNLFEPQGVADSALVRFLNAFPSSVSTNITTGPLSWNLPFATVTNNQKVRAKVDTTYKFILTYAPAVVETLTMTLSPKKQYSIVIWDSSGVRRTRAYTH